MWDLFRFFLGLQLMINGFVFSVHLMYLVTGGCNEFKLKSYVISSVLALILFLFVMSFPLIDKFVMWIKQ